MKKLLLLLLLACAPLYALDFEDCSGGASSISESGIDYAPKLSTQTISFVESGTELSTATFAEQGLSDIWIPGGRLEWVIPPANYGMFGADTILAVTAIGATNVFSISAVYDDTGEVFISSTSFGESSSTLSARVVAERMPHLVAFHFGLAGGDAAVVPSSLILFQVAGTALLSASSDSVAALYGLQNGDYYVNPSLGVVKYGDNTQFSVAASSVTGGTLGNTVLISTVPALNGAQLTNLTAANVTGSHTLPDGVLSTNVPLLNAANAFTNNQTITASAAGQIPLTVVTPHVNTTNDPTQYIVQADTTTTGNTATTIWSYTIPSGKVIGVHALVVARRTGGSSGTANDSAFYVRDGSAKDVSGTATATGAGISTTATLEDQAGWDCTLSVSGGDVLIRVTGATNNNVSWHAHITLVVLGS